MKKSKFILMGLLIVVLVLNLVLVPVGVKANSQADIWTAPEAAKSFVDIDGKGVRMYLYSVHADELGDFDYARVVGVRSYTFDNGRIVSGSLYKVGSGYFDTSLADLIAYYLSKYGSGALISTSDRAYVYFDVSAQRFKLEYHGSDYIGFWIEKYVSDTSYQYQEGYGQGYQEGIIVNHEAAYYEGYDTGYDVGYDVGYDDARPEMDILLITLIMFMLSVFVYFKFRLRWVLIATILLWFVPIFLIDNVFIQIFSVIMIIVTIVIIFFNDDREEDLE